MSIEQAQQSIDLDNDAQDSVLVEKPQDVQALQALSLYGRRLPAPLIAKQLGVSLSQCYKLIRRAKQIIGLDPNEALPKALLLTDDLIRQGFLQLQDIDGQINEKGEPLSGPAKAAMKQAILTQINNFLLTQLKAVQIGQPKTESITVEAVQTDVGLGARVVLKREAKPITELLKEVQAEGAKP